MKVEMWSDFVCPYCYIGKRRFEAGLDQFEHKDKIQLVARSFELDPDIPVEGNPSVRDMLAAKYGMPVEEADANIKHTTEQAAELGLEFNMDGAIRTNTLDAHRLSHLALEHGKQDEFSERVFRAHFTDKLHIGRHETLIELAVDAGLPRADVERVLENDDYKSQVRTDQDTAIRIGVRGVPHFVINDRYVVRGAHPSSTFLGALQKAWEEAAEQ